MFVCVFKCVREGACARQWQRGGSGFTQNAASRPRISFTPFLTRVSQRFYSPRGLLVLQATDGPLCSPTGAAVISHREAENRLLTPTVELQKQ